MEIILIIELCCVIITLTLSIDFWLEVMLAICAQCSYTVKLLFNKNYIMAFIIFQNFPKMQEMPFQRVKIQFVPELPRICPL